MRAFGWTCALLILCGLGSALLAVATGWPYDEIRPYLLSGTIGALCFKVWDE